MRWLAVAAGLFASGPLAADDAELGRRLFHDPGLSGPGTIACADCHPPTTGFADRAIWSFGATGERLQMNTPGFARPAAFGLFGRADPRPRPLEDQIRRALFGRAPVEMGVAGHEAEVARRLAATHGLAGDPAAVLDRAVAALARHLTTLAVAPSPWDRARAGGADALDPAALRGAALFHGPRLGCAGCHDGPDLGGAGFANTGLYQGPRPPASDGLARFTGRAEDIGKFRVPSLRNVALTWPYMHDGGVGDLAAVVAIYARGGRLLTGGAHPGDGRLDPNRDPRVTGFTLTDGETADLLAFLEALTTR
jgi:cytochrome c peroxidase